MTKTYKSGLGNLTVCGITFRTYSNNRGSYYTTSNREEQEMLERSPHFGSIYRLQRQPKVVEEKSAVAEQVVAEEEKPQNVFMTASLQEAKQIIANVRAERGLSQKNITNTGSVLKAAQELGLRFPNIKVK